MSNQEPRKFVVPCFKRAISIFRALTADVQSWPLKRIPLIKRLDSSECCACAGVIVASTILFVSPFSVTDGWWAIPTRIILFCLAFWRMLGAFSYPVAVVFVDLAGNGEILSPVRSILLLFVNVLEIIIHFGSFYILSSSIGYQNCANAVTSRFDAIYFSIVTITTLGYGDIRPIGYLGKVLVSIEVPMGIILIVTVLAGFLKYDRRLKQTKQSSPSGRE